MTEAETIGFLESCSAGPGFLVLSGWAASSEKGRLSRLVLNVDGVGEVLIPELSFRADLADAGIANGYAAFERLVRIGDGAPEQPSVHVVTKAGAVRISSAGTNYGAFLPCGRIDWANDAEISGWVIDPQVSELKPSGGARVRIARRIEIPVELRISRPDLSLDRGAGDQLFGFLVSTAVIHEERQRVPAEDTIVELISGANTLHQITLPAVERLDSQSIPARSSVASPVDAIEKDIKVKVEQIFSSDGKALIVGWASFKDSSAINPPIIFKLGDSVPVTVLELDYRSDLAKKDIAGGVGGFSVVIETNAEITKKDTLSVSLNERAYQVSLKDAKFLDGSWPPSISFRESSGIIGAIWSFDDPALINKNHALVVEGVDIAFDLVEPRFTRKIWSISGLIPSEFYVRSQAVFAALRAAGIPPSSASSSFSASIKKGDITLASTTGRLHIPHRGRLEEAAGEKIRGWLAASPETAAELDVYLDGTRYATVKADRLRADLVSKGIVKRGGGFQLAIGNPEPEARVYTVAVHPAYQKEPLQGPTKELDLPAPAIRHKATYATMLSAAARGVSIIIPVYNAHDDLALCLESLCYWTTFPCRVIIIDDCSPDPRVDVLLNKYRSKSNFIVLKNDHNLGFTKTVNRGIELSGDDDVIFLNSDTILTPLWLQGLRAAAYSAPRIATATPLSNNAGVFSVPEINASNHIPDYLGIDGMARLVQQSSSSCYPRVPTGNGFCLYVRRACIEEIGGLDQDAFPVGYGEENDFCMRALHQGFEHVLDDRTYVYHKRSASFGPSKSVHYENGRSVLAKRYPEYSRLTSVFGTSPDILGMRWRVRRSIESRELPRPRILFVISTETGGTPQTNRDLMSALRDRFDTWLMRCDASEIHLWRIANDGETLVEKLRLTRPLEPLIHRSQDYDEKVFDLITKHAFEVVHARHMGWHSLGLQSVCERIGVPFVLSLHDFYAVCPSIKLLDENYRYCGGKCTESPGECSVELWDRSSFPALKNNFIHKWQATFGELLGKADALVTTSPFAYKTFISNFPVLADRKFRIIPHGRDILDVGLWCSVGDLSLPLRVLVPGNISIAKGANLIADIADIDQGRSVEFHILGDHGRLKQGAGIVTHGRYKRDDFVNMARDIGPHVGAVFSIWPETYCHTLTEMWSMGLPVVGMSIGAVGERIGAHGGGWLVSPLSTAKEVLTFFQGISSDSSRISEQIEKIRIWQEGYGRYYTTRYMSAEYHRLYLDVLDGRRPFVGDAERRNYIVIAEFGVSEYPDKSIESWRYDKEDEIIISFGKDVGALRQEGILVDAIRMGELETDLRSELVSIADRRGIPVLW
jgi:GT2 family glycosyltransferase/glycosyltransferase involved in cell wall biosynthesis